MDRDLFKEKAKNTIDDLFQKIDELEKKKENLSENLKGAVSKKMEKLKHQKKDVQEKYEKLETATTESWNDVKEAFSKSTDIFKKTISNISEHF